MPKTGFEKKTTLFSRIMIRLSLPLIFLAVTFSALQLWNKITTLHELHQIQSRFTFDSIQKSLQNEVMERHGLGDIVSFREMIDTMINLHPVENIEIFDLLKREPVIQSENSVWSAFDFKGMEESLYQKQSGKNYHVRVNRQTKKLIAYVPLKSPDNQGVYIARILFSLADIKDALQASRWALGLMLILILLAGSAIGHGLAKSIVKPIREINTVTQEIIKGHLGKQVEIHTGDEIEELAHRFNRMSLALKEMKQQAEDANPLTQLPGNQGIFRELSQRIYEKQKLVLFHVDIDRFKVFNDHFGLALGDRAISNTAALLKKAVEEKGSADDFIGHQGGDDFIIITRPGHAKDIAEYVCEHFSPDVVRTIYKKEDFERGYTLALDRRRQTQTGEEVMFKFPLIAISLAGVSNAKKDFADYTACMAAAIEVKKETKQVMESSYLIQE
ncbi:MAG: sensor domain-containing diguanylate cyclase [Candidatus Omnitrophica bacterium]|nr:sensor domain-containing diguanylate cyclase [Candidatus Omnitrophota bacterium]